MIYFWSDLHIGHNKPFIYQDRGFKDIDGHDQYIIDTWRTNINPSDEIYILGDLSWRRGEETNKILETLPGQKYLIHGNHDYHNDTKHYQHHFKWTKDYYELKHNKQVFILCHYPIESWNKKFHGSIHLHGHIHNSEITQDIPNRINIGVDKFKEPVSIDAVLSLLRRT